MGWKPTYAETQMTQKVTEVNKQWTTINLQAIIQWEDLGKYGDSSLE
jgi:hypothetical protein